MPHGKSLTFGKMFIARKQKSPQLSSITSASNHSGKYLGEGKDIPQLIQGSFVSLLAAFLQKLRLCPFLVHPEKKKKSCSDVQLDPILSGILMFLLKRDKITGECGRRNWSRSRVNAHILPCSCFFYKQQGRSLLKCLITLNITKGLVSLGAQIAKYVAACAVLTHKCKC